MNYSISCMVVNNTSHTIDQLFSLYGNTGGDNCVNRLWKEKNKWFSSHYLNGLDQVEIGS